MKGIDKSYYYEGYMIYKTKICKLGKVIEELGVMKELPLKTTKEVDTEKDFYQKLIPIIIESVEQCKHIFEKVENETTSIQYKKTKILVDELKEYFNAKTAAEVGRGTFDYRYNIKNKL